MPLYEYYCPPCGSQFEMLRPMTKMDDPAVCPSGHTTNNRVLSLFAPVMRASGDVATAVRGDGTVLGDCCGGVPGHIGCACC